MRFTRDDWLILTLLAAATAWLFWPAVRFEFIYYDDPEYVFQNDRVKDGLSRANVAYAFTARELGHWHPVTWLSYMLDAQLAGIDAAAFHRTNVILHACSAVAAYLLLRAMTGSRWRSGLAAALFALHPLRVESVAWVAERKDVLSVLLGLLALLAYVGYAKRKRAWQYAAALALFALSLLSKPMLLTLPFVMLLIDYWPLRRHESERPRRLLLEKLPLLALTAASATVTVLTVRSVGGLNPAERFPLWPRLSNAVVSLGHYLLDIIWPTKLAMLYPFPPQPQPLAALGVGALLLLVTAACLLWLRRWPHLAVGWFWFVGMLIPVSGLVSVGELARADRYTYFAMIGVILMAVWSIPPLPRASAWATAGAGAAVLAALCAVTRAQLRHWRSSETIFAHTTWVAGPSATIEMNWGVALAARGDHAGAVERYRRAWELAPGLPAVVANYANALQATGRVRESIERYREALVHMPDHPMIWHNRGVAHMRLGEWPDAEQCYRQVLRLRPDFAPARQNLNRVLARQGKPPE
jgi:tetratricopeptide (TPR) repeat protein